VNRHRQSIANTHSEKRASNLRKILMPVFVHTEVLESGMLHPGKGSGRRKALPPVLFFLSEEIDKKTITADPSGNGLPTILHRP
jgi:hypothetical protein